ncbi:MULTISPECIES: type II secretion system F family protein [unclassified Duganella]|uniref:type II secretion system F family protein n=1 Tax=unclassified Duganella TaxID=2636909 RepID=UPI000886EF21|nr:MULTISPECIES: type II secretion system F family protein [unclassified Duganella]SDG95044.1 tight adherence protein B [Duganella sp. OV458]SDJ47458.1 tight adherence protein B [Duganella sp. OV510]
MDGIFTAFVVLLFAAVILMIEGGWLWWSGAHGGAARRISRRLRMMAASGQGGIERVDILKRRTYSRHPALEKQLRRIGRLAALDRLLLQAGVRWSVAQFLGCSLMLMAAGLLLPKIIGMPWLPAIGTLLLAAGLPWLTLMRIRAARLHKLEEQLPEAADFLGRALRAGHSFANVMQMVGEEMPDPIAAEFKFAYEEINYGVPMNEALHNLALRVPLTDLRYLVIAVLIQRESGGNLAEVFGNISRLIRARLKLLSQVRVMSAEGRMSAWVLCLLPLGVMALMALANPAYVRVLWTDPVGVKLMWYSLAVAVSGVLWMRKLIRIRV